VLLQEEQIHSFQEADEMFDEKMEAWFNKLREEGLRGGMAQGLEQSREQGVLLGMCKMAGQLLQLKFGDNATRAAWPDGLSGPQLDELVARIWAADDEAALRAAVASPT
jgi:flagellar biosynthesis/type III secretory pathway protein FliH